MIKSLLISSLLLLSLTQLVKAATIPSTEFGRGLLSTTAASIGSYITTNGGFTNLLQPQHFIAGDSQSDDGGTPGSANWTIQLETNINYIGKSGRINTSKAGRTLADYNSNYTNLLQQYFPLGTSNVVWLSLPIGYNDLGSLTLAQYKTNYTNLVLRARRDGAKIVAFNIWNTNAVDEDTRTNFNHWLLTNTPIRDYYVTVTNTATSDGIHPTAAASAGIADSWWLTVSNAWPNLRLNNGQGFYGTTTFLSPSNVTEAIRVVGGLVFGPNSTFTGRASSGIYFYDNARYSSSITCDFTDGLDDIIFKTFLAERMRILQGGISGCELKFNGTGGSTWYPLLVGEAESVHSGVVGSFGIRTNANPHIVLKTEGTGTTGWSDVALIRDFNKSTNIVYTTNHYTILTNDISVICDMSQLGSTIMLVTLPTVNVTNGQTVSLMSFNTNGAADAHLTNTLGLIYANGVTNLSYCSLSNNNGSYKRYGTNWFKF